MMNGVQAAPKPRRFQRLKYWTQLMQMAREMRYWEEQYIAKGEPTRAAYLAHVNNHLEEAQEALSDYWRWYGS